MSWGKIYLIIGAILLAFFVNDHILQEEAKSHYYNGLSLYKAGDYAGAEVELREATNIYHAFTPSHYDLGFLLYNQLRFDEAEKEFEMVQESSEFDNVRYDVGGVLSQTRLIKEAKEEFTREIESNPFDTVKRTFTYVVRGQKGYITLPVHTSLNVFLATLPREFYCDPCPSDRELQLRFLDQKEQDKYLKKLVDIIKSKTSDPNEQARIAISLVQNIPYDDFGALLKDQKERFPYEVLYNNKGVCGEKSKLLAYILRELGFGVSLFFFEAENHMAVGIKCPSQYSYKDSGYCFIEAANPTIPTYSEGDYIGVGKLRSTPEVIKISDGLSFDCTEEYNDAQDWNKLVGRKFLNDDEYDRYMSLVRKYGLEQNSENNDSNSSSVFSSVKIHPPNPPELYKIFNKKNDDENELYKGLICKDGRCLYVPSDFNGSYDELFN